MECNQELQFYLNKKIIFFDQDCLICNRFVNFILKHEKQPECYFSHITGKAAEILNIQDLNSIVLWDKNQIYYRSSATIRILYSLNFFNKLISIILFLCPKPIRDIGYRVFAHYRNKILSSSCHISTQTLEQRILE